MQKVSLITKLTKRLKKVNKELEETIAVLSNKPEEKEVANG